ncbi:hypothetical protein M569_13732 [Genlisea aurea]|uniref:Pseudouridine synthase RsuA/RluA-like domain-containing protein n=1 Tax=Genlisea aurea TaxID=192259 RepID=S8DE64_9LAMI|nr:hypothetical protein M569_13732 [Genlisea aurea]
MSSILVASSFCRSFLAPIYNLRTLKVGGVRGSSVLKKRCLCCRSTASSAIVNKICSSTSNSYPPYGRLLPCPIENTLPRVEHLVVSEGGPVLEYISNALEIPPLFVADLIHFGAVFYALVCPDPPSTAAPEEMEIYRKYTDRSVLSKRPSIKGKTRREAQKTFRITRTDELVETGTYLRVHVHPKRFPRCYEIDWKSRIIAVTANYVVLDKPAGTSVGGTTDNIEECCATFASRALGLSEPLRTTHQIDNCTEGCVVFAKTKEYCSVFHGKIREKTVKKLYLALTSAPVPIGIITHYMRPVNIAPRLISSDFISGWHMCRLEVLECRKVRWPSEIAQRKQNVDDCGWPNRESAYECKINLLTGKTHQIRAQLAARGAPLVGDSMYMPAAMSEMQFPGLNPFGSNKREYEEDEVWGMEGWIKAHGKEPSGAIGLQARHVSWDDDEQQQRRRHSYEAGSPWWR